MRYLICFIFCVHIGYGLDAQQRPQVYLHAASYCDIAPFQLVFFDDFNGHHIDTHQWTTYISWHGIYREVNGEKVYGDNPDFCGSRLSNNNGFFLDENVEVSNGTCKLWIKNEAYTLDCNMASWEQASDCNMNTGLDCPNSTTRYYTAGGIFTKYRFPNHEDGTPHLNHYNAGKFEARLKHPVFDGAWTCMWTWYGTRVNEIDITEAWGGRPRSFFNLMSHIGGKMNRKLRKNTIAFHAWNYADNPFGLPATGQDEVSYKMYNHQEWTTVLAGHNIHQQDEWHIYTCEWDTVVVRIFLDGVQEYELWKYFQYQPHTAKNLWGAYKIRIPASCMPEAGMYYLSEGFPYEPESMSQLRFTTGLTNDYKGLPVTNTTLGKMEIDYVKIWQRHPEQTHRQVILEPNTSFNLPSTSTIQKLPIVIIKNEIATMSTQYFFGIIDYKKIAHCEWKITYTDLVTGLQSEEYWEGSHIASLILPQNWEASQITWEMRWVDTDGVAHMQNGQMRPFTMPQPQLEIPATYTSKEQSFYYLQARMNPMEWMQYESDVRGIVSFTYSTNDPIQISNAIFRIKIDQLLPYLYFEDLEKAPSI